MFGQIILKPLQFRKDLLHVLSGFFFLSRRFNYISGNDEKEDDDEDAVDDDDDNNRF